MPIDLKNISKGQLQNPPRILLIGEEGVGKSTFGNRAPSPIFLCAESGLVGPEFATTPNYAPKNWTDAVEFVDTLITQEHAYKTLVVDTLDWLIPLLNNAIAGQDKKSNIEEFGYGKGYTLAAMEWRKFISKLEQLSRKGMTVILCAHCHIKTFSNPAGDNYDRYELKLDKQIAALSKEWADAVLFAKFEIYTHKESQKAKAKGVGGTSRVVHTVKHPAWDAKNRYGMPEQLPLDWDDIMAAIKGTEKADQASILSEIMEMLEKSGDKDKEKILEYVEKNKNNVANLTKALNRLRVKAVA